MCKVKVKENSDLQSSGYFSQTNFGDSAGSAPQLLITEVGLTNESLWSRGPELSFVRKNLTRGAMCTGPDVESFRLDLSIRFKVSLEATSRSGDNKSEDFFTTCVARRAQLSCGPHWNPSLLSRKTASPPIFRSWLLTSSSFAVSFISESIGRNSSCASFNSKTILSHHGEFRTKQTCICLDEETTSKALC